jgi:hypothetical protein
MDRSLIKINETLESIAESLKVITHKMEIGIVVVVAANSPALPVIIDENSSLEVGINSNNGDIDVCVHGSVITSKSIVDSDS